MRQPDAGRRSAPTRKHPWNVCVFAGARSPQDPALLEAAYDLGDRLARAGFGLVYGGGGTGMMGAVSDGALNAGGQVTGVIPRQLIQRELGRRDLTDLRIVSDMHARKRLMYQLSSSFVTLPGGLGTWEELFESLTWTKLGLHGQPSFVLNANGFYTPVRTLLDRAVEQGLITPADQASLVTCNSVADIIDRLTEARRP